MVDKECNLRAGVYKVQTFGTTHPPPTRASPPESRVCGRDARLLVAAKLFSALRDIGRVMADFRGYFRRFSKPSASSLRILCELCVLCGW
jgi:hypothetical protein